VEALSGRAVLERDQSDGDGRHGHCCGDQNGPPRDGSPPGPRELVDAGTKPGRRLDLRGDARRELDRALLLGEPRCELGRIRDPRFERCSSFRRERAVGESSQLHDVSVCGVVLWAASQRHGCTKGNPAPALTRARLAG
jgi:hypothetical protein